MENRFILGFPFETKESVTDTVKFAREFGTDFATFFLLSPHPTSDVYGYFEKEGLINFSSALEDNELDEEKDVQYTIELLYNGLKIFLRSFYRLATKKLLYSYPGRDLKQLIDIKQ